MEKMEVTLRQFGSPRSTTIRVYYWQDRWVWIDAREASKRGWLWSFTSEGRMKGGKAGMDLLAYVEQFNDLLPIDGSQPDNLAASFWQRRLLGGPRPVR